MLLAKVLNLRHALEEAPYRQSVGLYCTGIGKFGHIILSRFFFSL